MNSTIVLVFIGLIGQPAHRVSLHIFDDSMYADIFRRQNTYKLDAAYSTAVVMADGDSIETAYEVLK